MIALVTGAWAGELTVQWDRALAPGQRVYVGGNGVNLRQRAVDGVVVTELTLGAPVEVLAIGEASTVGQRTAPWVRVRAGEAEGWLFGGLLTDARVDTDLDQDGTPEVVVLAYRTDRAAVLRVAEGGAVAELVLGGNPDIDGPDVQMSLSTTTATETGVPLVKVYWPGREMCGSGTRTRWVSYAGGAAKVAVEGSTWADAPVWQTVEVTFHPAGRTVTVDEKSGEEADTIRHEVRELRYVDGVFTR